jgi:hypothetical protein
MRLSAGVALLAGLLLAPHAAMAVEEPEFHLFPEDGAGQGGVSQSNPPRGVSKSNMTPSPMTNREKFHYYVETTYGPTSLLRSAFSASISQARDSQPEWGQGMEGYGKRFASKFGNHAIKRTIQHSLVTLWHEDPRYYRSERTGFWPRTGYAITRTFVIRTDAGREKFNDSRVIATVTASLISRSWHPEDDRTWRSGIESAGKSLAIDVGMNVLKEFWPEIRSLLRR